MACSVSLLARAASPLGMAGIRDFNGEVQAAEEIRPVKAALGAEE